MIGEGEMGGWGEMETGGHGDWGTWDLEFGT